MTAFRAGPVRCVWLWCLLYTAAVPAGARRRRRAELRCHLWESECRGLAAGAVLVAAVRGAPDDVGWALAAAAAGLGRLLTQPMTYVGAALVFPLQASVVAAIEPTTTAHPFEAAGAIGGGAMLVVAGILRFLARARGGS